ncbi:MAG: 50S ribosomal protein L6 [Methanohalobium sp.]|uniref:50S ribosomal protein L6 n=1 Tax=Methanohalobium sp. TaxID=2837493 RepID=UPI0039792703
MVKELRTTIPIPEDITVSLDGKYLTVTGPKGMNKKFMWYPGVVIKPTDSEITIDALSTRRDKKAIIGTFAAHVRNMITGVTDGFEYRMKVVYSHFPMQLKVDGNKFLISNFLGEKKPRVANIVGDTTVKVDGDEIVITGINKEDVGQTAANIEQTTKINRFDPRIFQDGIYIVEKV